MFSFSRTVLALGSLLVSGSLAEAGNSRAVGFPPEGPLPIERPMMLGSDTGLLHAAITPAMDSKPSRRGRRSRLALGRAADGNEQEAGLRGSLAAGTEQASETPNKSTIAATAGPREGASPTIADLVTRHAQENGVPVSLAQAVVAIESRGNPRASNRGALGLMQIKPGTARSAGFSGGASGLLVAETNLRFGMKILGDAFRTSGGDVCRALMLYQSGHLATHMSRSNRAYCGRARAIMAGA